MPLPRDTAPHPPGSLWAPNHRAQGPGHGDLDLWILMARV